MSQIEHSGEKHSLSSRSGPIPSTLKIRSKILGEESRPWLILMLFAGIIEIGAAEHLPLPAIDGILYGACSSHEYIDARLVKSLNCLGPQTTHYHHLHAFREHNLRGKALSAHVLADIGEHPDLLAVQIHYGECGSPAEVLAYCLIHASVAHGRNSDLHCPWPPLPIP